MSSKLELKKNIVVRIQLSGSGFAMVLINLIWINFSIKDVFGGMFVFHADNDLFVQLIVKARLYESFMEIMINELKMFTKKFKYSRALL